MAGLFVRRALARPTRTALKVQTTSTEVHKNVNNLGCRHLFFCRYLQSVPVDSALFMKPFDDVTNAGTFICHKDGSNISGIEVSCI
jgi:hypothetical protein